MDLYDFTPLGSGSENKVFERPDITGQKFKGVGPRFLVHGSMLFVAIRCYLLLFVINCCYLLLMVCKRGLHKRLSHFMLFCTKMPPEENCQNRCDIHQELFSLIDCHAL